MARERMVTRTITDATVKCMVVSGREVIDLEVYVGSVEGLKETQIIEKAKTNTPDGYIFVKEEQIIYSEKLYGMPESEFIKLAKVLPPRTTKAE